MRRDNHEACLCVRPWQQTCRYCITCLTTGRSHPKLHPKCWECAAEQQKHALPKLVGCRVGDGERAACRKGSGCPTLPGPRNEPIMSWGLGMGPVPKGSNAEGNKYTHHCYCLALEDYMAKHCTFLKSCFILFSSLLHYKMCSVTEFIRMIYFQKDPNWFSTCRNENYFTLRCDCPTFLWHNKSFYVPGTELHTVKKIKIIFFLLSSILLAGKLTLKI